MLVDALAAEDRTPTTNASHGVGRVVLRAIPQLPGLLFVDPLLAILRRRPLGASVGRRIRAVLAGLGPMYDKLAQLLASHATVAPGSLLDGFQLRSPAYPPVPWCDVVATLESDLGPLDTVVRSIDRSPFRTSATAVYHRAALADGSDVVVKVRRPELTDSIAEQRAAAALAARVAGSMLPKGLDFDQGALGDELMRCYSAQLDLRNEAANLVRLTTIVREARIDGVVLPEPIEHLVTDKVLVTSYLEGISLEDVPASEDLVDRAARMLFAGARNGLFPADLRPANLLLLRDGSLGIVGFEDCERLSEEQARGVDVLLAGVLSGDTASQVEGLARLGALADPADGKRLRARLEWTARHHGDVWASHPLEGVPVLFQAFDGIEGVTLPTPVLRLAENALHLQALASASGRSLDWRAPIAAVRPSRRGVRTSTRERLADDEIDAAAIMDPVAPVYSLRAISRLMPDALRPRRENLVQVLAAVAFIVVNAVVGLRWAIPVLMLFGAQAAIRRKLRGEQLSRGTKVGGLVAALLGTLAVVSGSAIFVFLPGIVFPAAFAVALVASMIARRPAYAVLAQYLWPLPARVRTHPAIERPLWWYSLALTVVHVAALIFTVWLLLSVSANTYLAVHTLLNQLMTPVSLVFLLAMKRTIADRAPRIAAQLAGG